MGNKEVRDILLRRIVRQDEQFWAAASPDTKFHFHGVRDGAGDVRLFGVMHLGRRYRAADMELSAVFSAAEKALYSLGCPIRLASMPERKACLYAPNWIAPVLLTVGQNEDELELMAYTGRSLLISRVRCRIALWILEQRLPEGIVCVGRSKKANSNKAEKPESSKKKGKKAAAAKKKKEDPERRKK